ncbi:hypothetical protein H2198_010375 [Neophaeococcomyces mojaviensis]|uniref:Uncharacterized protein n=1 Tax=Neophaeococcomyces mojaviensis TaxID=3383035 RepID=A0ACC2ZRR5_9EURO|nr:hypothetical protein H2198_010375 [Knufia sp. JES_112]
MSASSIVSLVDPSPASWNTLDLTRQDDVWLRAQLHHLGSGNGRHSVRTHNNIRTAVEYLSGQRQARKFVKVCWQRAWDTSPQAFILLSASFTHHHLLRRGQHACQQLTDLLERNRSTINGHPGLSVLTSQYFGDHKRLAEADVSDGPSECTDLSHRPGPETERHIRASQVHLERYEQPPVEEPTVLPWLDYLRNEPAFLIHLDPACDHSTLTLLISAPEDLHTLWRTHTTGLPMVVPAAACWRQPAPTFEQLWAEAAKIKAHDLRVYEQGEKSANATLAFCQMAKPNPDNPTCIIGMEPRAWVRGKMFGSCAQLHRRVTTYLEQRMVLNMTPKFSFVDLHIDYGRDGISATLHECEKVWMVYPPTPHNLQWMAEHRGQHAKLAHGMTVLEGGVVVHTTSAEAIYLPAGCLHAVFTVASGFLVSMDCTTQISVWPCAQYLRYNVQAEFEADEQRDCYFLFLEALDVALQNAGERDAFRAWIAVDDVLQMKRKNDRVWVRAARKVWDEYLKSEPIVDVACPCAGAVSSSFLNHLKDHHLGWLFDDRRRSRHDMADRDISITLRQERV